MKWLICPGLFVACVVSVLGESADIYIGTYTRGDSKGIYRAGFDTESGKLEAPALVAEIDNPSFLALSTNQRNLFAVVETGKFKGEAGGGLVAYRIKRDGTLLEKSSQNTGGGAPCHVSLTSDGKVALVANYSGGNVASFAVTSGAEFGRLNSLIQHKGSSVNPKRQKGPHAHAINVFGDGVYAAAADLGTDSVFIYRIKYAALELLAELNS